MSMYLTQQSAIGWVRPRGWPGTSDAGVGIGRRSFLGRALGGQRWAQRRPGHGRSPLGAIGRRWCARGGASRRRATMEDDVIFIGLWLVCGIATIVAAVLAD